LSGHSVQVNSIKQEQNPRTVLKFLMHGQRQDSAALGFLPLVALERYAENEWIYTTRINGELAAYVVFGIHKEGLKIYQVWTVKDARRLTAAAAVIAAAENTAISRGKKKSSAWVAEDLEAVRFWNALGYRNTGMRTGGRARRRIHLHFERDLITQERSLIS
jgi:GNAT superfamily N-acetyltransferase